MGDTMGDTISISSPQFPAADESTSSISLAKLDSRLGREFKHRYSRQVSVRWPIDVKNLNKHKSDFSPSRVCSPHDTKYFLFVMIINIDSRIIERQF